MKAYQIMIAVLVVGVQISVNQLMITSMVTKKMAPAGKSVNVASSTVAVKSLKHN